MNMSQKALLCGFAVLLLAPSMVRANTVSFIVTDQQGQNTQLDISHTSSWTFTETVAFQLGGARLIMRAEANTVDVPDNSLLLALHDGTGSGTILASITLTYSEFCGFKAGYGDGCSNQFAGNDNHYVPFQFTDTGLMSATVTPYITLANHRYTVTLSSNTLDSGSHDYKIKGDAAEFSFDPPVTEYVPSVPEPSTYALAASALGAIALMRRRRSLR
jgi:hypothetical protein